MMRRIAPFVAVAVLAGCAPHSEEEPVASPTAPPAGQTFPNWPSLMNDFRFHWTAAPGIDLTTGPAVVIRAYIESYELATMTFNANDVYPGFLRATPENESTTDGDYRSELTNVRPLGAYGSDKPPTGAPHFGFNTDHLLELTPEGSGFRAIVCTGFYSNFIPSAVRPDAYISAAARETDEGVAPFPDSPDAGISVRQVELTQQDPRIPPGSPRSTTEPQEGPSPAPQADVFGNWFITGSSSSGWGPIARPVLDNFPTPELEARCSGAMPHNGAERRAMMTGYKDEPPPSGVAVPGWPLKSE